MCSFTGRQKQRKNYLPPLPQHSHFHPSQKKDAALIRSKLMMEIGKDYTVCGEFILTPEMSNALAKRRIHKNKPARTHHIPRKTSPLPSPPRAATSPRHPPRSSYLSARAGGRVTQTQRDTFSVGRDLLSL